MTLNQNEDILSSQYEEATAMWFVDKETGIEGIFFKVVFTAG